jgi:hypothetical protein
VQNGAIRTELTRAASCAGRSASKTRVNALMTRASIFFARGFYEEGWIAGSSPAMTARMSSPRTRGPIITAGGYGSRLSPRCREGRPGRRLLGPSEAPTYGCAKSGLGQFPCFGVVLYNGNCNSNVSAPPRPKCVAPNVTPHMSPTMWHHPSSSNPSSPHVSPSVVIMCFGFEAPMS